MVNANCKCNQLPRIFDSEKYPNHLRGRIEIIDKKNEGWRELGKCRECGQYWQLDKWDKLQTICAIKIDFPDNWQNYNDEPVRLELLMKSRGGLSEEECIKKNCKNKALKTLAYCLEHSYRIGLRE